MHPGGHAGVFRQSRHSHGSPQRRPFLHLQQQGIFPSPGFQQPHGLSRQLTHRLYRLTGGYVLIRLQLQSQQQSSPGVKGI